MEPVDSKSTLVTSPKVLDGILLIENAAVRTASDQNVYGTFICNNKFFFFFFEW